MEIKKIAVLGAGAMGHGIAQLAAINGYDVALRDINEEMVQQGIKKIRWSVGKFIEKGKLKRLTNGILYVVTWEKYQFTDRYRRMFKQDSSAKEEQVFPKKETISREEREKVRNHGAGDGRLLIMR